MVVSVGSPNELEAITETSCLVNVMHEILVNRWNQRKPCIAICPTQYLEGKIGLDVALPLFDKGLGLQFKAYKRYNKKALNYFKIYPKQHRTLLGYPYNCAYYVFPDYKTHKDMALHRILEYLRRPYLILNNTWFVEVHNLPANTKKVTRDDLIQNIIPSIRWSQLSNQIDECRAGFKRVKINEKEIKIVSPEEETLDKLKIPSGTFSYCLTSSRNIEEYSDEEKSSLINEYTNEKG